MITALKITLLIASILLVIVITAQESRSDGLSGSIGGGAEQLFGKKKSNLYDKLAHRATIVVSIAVLILSVIGLYAMR